MDSLGLRAHGDPQATKVGHTSNSICGLSIGQMASLSAATSDGVPWWQSC